MKILAAITWIPGDFAPASNDPASTWLSVMMSSDEGQPRRRSTATTSGSKANMLRADPMASRSELDVPRSTASNTSRATRRYPPPKSTKPAHADSPVSEPKTTRGETNGGQIGEPR